MAVTSKQTVDGRRIVIAARSAGSVTLARYTPSGQLDTSFDTDGKVSTDMGGYDYSQGLALQPDNKIVVVGYAEYLGGGADFVLARYNVNGSLDTTFDTDGKVVTSFNSYDYATGVVVQSSGRIVAAGYTQVSGSNWDFAVARYNSDGSLDATFDSDGKLTTAFGGGNLDEAHDLAVQPDGKIVVGGSTTASGGTPDFALARYNVGLEERVYAQWDANFNVTSLVDQDGAVLERFEYTPYGEVTVLDVNWAADADTVSDYGWNYLHQGGRRDINTGLYHFRNRDYGPTLGRWVQRDPLGYVDGFDLYQYVNSNPISRMDSDGTYYWKLFTYGLSAGRACIAGYELKECLECISDTDKLLTKAQAWMEPERFAEYRAAILNSHPCYSICSAAGKDGLKAAASLALKWLRNAVGGPFR